MRTLVTLDPNRGSGADNPRAERYIRKYLTQEPEPGNAPLANAHWRLGRLREKEGRRADAIAEIDQATKVNPKLEDAVKELNRLRAAR
jgi:tetratricopeptide (TPR) repeat protein